MYSTYTDAPVVNMSSEEREERLTYVRVVELFDKKRTVTETTYEIRGCTETAAKTGQAELQAAKPLTVKASARRSGCS